MTPITLVMAYYDNSDMLAAHYKALLAMHEGIRSNLNIIIVDDGSPDAPAFPPEVKRKRKSRSDLEVTIFRMLEDVPWNQDACRNIGVKHSETQWVLLTDMDHMLPESLWEHLIFERQLDPNIVYQFERCTAPDMEPYKFHPNTWLMTREMYERVGGYDERFAGYYGTDGDFRDRVMVEASKIERLPNRIIRVPRNVIADASTTRYARKGADNYEAISSIKKKRAESDNKRPIRFKFPYDEVYPGEN